MSDNEDGLDLFQEPDGFYSEPPAHTFRSVTLKSGEQLKLRFVGQSPLWGHLLWQAGLIISEYLQDHRDQYLKGRTVLELGAGAGLPSLLASHIGAEKVVVTDYPDNNLIENLEYNIQHCLDDQSEPRALDNIVAQGYLWGASVQPLIGILPNKCGFDTLILADLLFNHTCHEALLQTITGALAHHSEAVALVFFTPYRPWLFEKDMSFFDRVREQGRLSVEKIDTWMMEKVMFLEDRGDETLRRTVFGYKLKWRAIP